MKGRIFAVLSGEICLLATTLKNAKMLTMPSTWQFFISMFCVLLRLHQGGVFCCPRREPQQALR